MGKINVLDRHVAELIAAGEVVERPASVAKELVENSIDAGASAVTVEIRHGGVTFLRVTDNGCGVAREDVPLAFLSHATSKVAAKNDLDAIATLGFRGEALASVAAVAHVEMLTRTSGELAGTRYGIDGGREKFCEDAGCPEGTTILVRDLFYNTPARMKFLKKDVTEGNAVAAVADKEALAHPEVSFRFLRDGRETLHTPGDGKLKSAVYAVFGRQFTSGLIPLEYELNGVTVTGFVSSPAAARPNRSMQNFFINGRYVKSRTAMVALEEGFKGSLMVGKVPACVLHLTVPFGAVDVNVHPAKIEVRFLNERPIFDAVYHGVKSALHRGDTPHVMKLSDSAAPAFRHAEPPAEQIRFAPRPAAEPGPAPAGDFPQPQAAPESVPAGFGNVRRVPVPPDIERDEDDVPAAPQEAPEPAPAASGAPERPVPENPASAPGPEAEKPEKFIGEAFGTYIILQRGDSLVFVDKHAAHERLLYEKLKAEGGKADRQMLLEPVPVTLDKNEYSAVLNALDVCAEAGFEIDDFGGGTVLVRSAPMILGGSGVAEAVMEIAGYLASSKTDLTTEKVDWLYHNVACRAAVKAGDPASPRELIDLVRRVEKEDVRYCPHGRPVFFLLTRKELEKQFGRIP
ncbi:MAG: DNA mismatch repair endonuclease MutL [Oscillospiraceae bacterium]|jgi:DNA mismatch repair protein MutL|nr:DNA mismatch repair endonuclease MutL [Oscillospiraceae bacterium]MCI1990737.1 DNA mismatch repair endonuclease MutL [Oscillospiraceae bacterium]MCI2035578.1 DNA mismatch repair endonuclease MutL [Oscillospiraceae bacterium]